MFIQKNVVPKHIAIIPDGNRRWARNKGKEDFEGHKEGISFDRVTGLFEGAREMGVKYFSLWLFSTENWKRSKREINYLFDLFLDLADKFKEYALENEVKFKHVGRKDRLPENIVNKLIELEKVTADFKDFEVQFCLDYGGRDEIVRAVNKALKSGKKEVTEQDFISLLDTYGSPDPDFIIRTSGEQRLSGFFSFQGDYAELYFEKKCFPEFSVEDLKCALEEFSNRKRTYGGN